jgi:hypothetical protein
MFNKCVAVGAVLGASGVALANPPLNLVPSRPDVAAANIQIDYNFNTLLFTATGLTQNLLYTNNPSEVATQLGGDDLFQLTAHINHDGSIAAGTASLFVYGGVGGTNNVLLMESHTLSQFGTDPNGLFEFVFSNGNGLLNPAAIGTAGVILSDFGAGQLAFANPFGFSNFGIGNADSFLIPSPAPAATLAIVIGIGAGRRRRR